ncbi:hypothetical protein F511_37530 [Dorcoceras hygrometricum]|uniref:Uncharacterized protein n=1 Tax=Dorcoceras hygrometricum TaxID=472368 RepID=A0A2Z7D506_9LAMI|nr:hypothetical protein F511_37530 [Dorcoceras hygrometricum]
MHENKATTEGREPKDLKNCSKTESNQLEDSGHGMCEYMGATHSSQHRSTIRNDLFLDVRTSMSYISPSSTSEGSTRRFDLTTRVQTRSHNQQLSLRLDFLLYDVASLLRLDVQATCWYLATAGLKPSAEYDDVTDDIINAKPSADSFLLNDDVTADVIYA